MTSSAVYYPQTSVLLATTHTLPPERNACPELTPNLSCNVLLEENWVDSLGLRFRFDPVKSDKVCNLVGNPNSVILFTNRRYRLRHLSMC